MGKKKHYDNLFEIKSHKKNFIQRYITDTKHNIFIWNYYLGLFHIRVCFNAEFKYSIEYGIEVAYFTYVLK